MSDSKQSSTDAYPEAVRAKLKKYKEYMEASKIGVGGSAIVGNAIIKIEGHLEKYEKAANPKLKGGYQVLIAQAAQTMKAWKLHDAPSQAQVYKTTGALQPMKPWREAVRREGVWYNCATGREDSIAYIRNEAVIANGIFCFVVLLAKPKRVLIGSREKGGHSAISNNADVLYAGEIIFKEGTLVEWNNESGHYTPGEAGEYVKSLLEPDKFKRYHF